MIKYLFSYFLCLQYCILYPISWFFCPGIHMAGPEQVVKYVYGGKLTLPHFNVSTIRSIEVINPQRVSTVRFAEIACKHQSLGFLDSIYHSIVNSRNAHNRRKNNVIFHCFPHFRINRSCMNFGQKMDLAQLNKAFIHHNQTFHDESICYGVSRGAGCLFNALALNTIPLQKIKGVILEGCFDAIEHVLDHTTTHAFDSLPKSFIKQGFNYIYTTYDPHGPRPIDLVEKYPLNIPTLFITSLNDHLIPPQLTINLFNQLKQRGHQQAYLLILQHSPHREYMKDPRDQSVYQASVNAFYKICKIEHDAQLAYSGNQYLISDIVDKTQLN